MRRVPSHIAIVLTASICLGLPVFGQSPVESAVTAKFALTKATADRSDIVTAGAVLVLKKDNFVMYSSDTPKHSTVIYKDGKLNTSGMMKFSAFSHAVNSNAAPINQRTFVTGEKFWLIGVETAPDGLVLDVLSDPYNNVRYTGSVKFPFGKGGQPSPDELLARVSEVVALDSPVPAAEAPAPEPPPAAMAPIPPPPPPPDGAPPPTISLGEKKEDVIAALGAPDKDTKAGGKEILTYKDMKVTLTGGKVSDVE